MTIKWVDKDTKRPLHQTHSDDCTDPSCKGCYANGMWWYVDSECFSGIDPQHALFIDRFVELVKARSKEVESHDIEHYAELIEGLSMYVLKISDEARLRRRKSLEGIGVDPTPKTSEEFTSIGDTNTLRAIASTTARAIVKGALRGMSIVLLAVMCFPAVM